MHDLDALDLPDLNLFLDLAEGAFPDHVLDRWGDVACLHSRAKVREIDWVFHQHTRKRLRLTPVVGLPESGDTSAPRVPRDHPLIVPFTTALA
jgi:hypothetical protein